MRLETSFGDALFKLHKERGIDMQDARKALESAILSAYKKKFGSTQNVKVEITPKWEEIKFCYIKKVVTTVENSNVEMTLDEALTLKPDAQPDDNIEFPLDISLQTFGHVAIQVAKQVIVQKLREAEKKNIYEQYKDKVECIISGSVQRIEKGNIIVRLGKSDAVLNYSEQTPGESYRVGDSIKMYVVEVKKSEQGLCQVILSRSNPGLVQKLFELEIPEIADRTVLVKAIAREPGYRTKIAVHATKPNIDPVGSCIGSKGGRIQMIINELHGEKIDIVRWSNNIIEFVTNALSPAKIINVQVLDETEKNIKVIVPDNQLSLAIGKDGQNVRLASKLVNYHLDIINESQYNSLRSKKE